MSYHPDEYYDEENDDMMSEAEIKDGDVVVTMKASALSEMARAMQHDVLHRLQNHIERAVEKKLSELVNEAVRKVIGDKAETLVLRELEKPRQKFNEWGSPTGPTVAFADVIPAVVESFLAEKVDEKGQRSQYSGSVPRVNWIIGQYVKRDIDTAVQSAVNSVTKQARDIVTAKVSAFVAEQMMPSIDVKTIGGAR